MTRQCNDGVGTEFSHWLRKQPEIGSEYGFVANNIDYAWGNYKTGKWMLIEEKRHGRGLTYSQNQMFKKMHRAINDKNYCGFYLVVFEKTNIDDGGCEIKRLCAGDKGELDFCRSIAVDRAGLIQFLMFDWPVVEKTPPHGGDLVSLKEDMIAARYS